MKYLILLLSLSSFAEYKKVINFHSRTPKNLKEIVQTIDLNKLENNSFESLLLKFNDYTALSTIDENFEKSVYIEEIKAILSFYPKRVFDPTKTLDLIAKANAEISKSNDPFLKKIENGLVKDINSIYESRYFRDYIRQRKSRLPLNKETRSIHRRLQTLSPWLEFLDMPMEEKELISREIKKRFLTNLLARVKVFTLSNKNPNEVPVKLFSIESIKIEPKKKEKLLPDGLAVNPSPDQNYTAPKELPKAVDDWVPLDSELDSDGRPLTKEDLFPKKMEAYTAPEKLPEGSDSWLLDL